MKILIPIMTFLFIYNVPFTGIPVSSSKIMVLAFLVMLLFDSNGKLSFNRDEIITFILGIVLILVSVLAMVLNATNDTSIVYSSFLLVVNNMLGAFLLVKILKRKMMLSLDYVFNLLITIAVVQAIIMILMMIYEPAYRFIADLAFLETRDSIRMRYGNARGYGLASSVTYGLGVVQSFSMFFLARDLQKERKLRHIIYYLLIVVSILVTGRTALIGIVLSIVYLLMTDTKAEKKGLRRFSGIVIIAVMTGIYLSLGAAENGLISSIQAYVFESANNFNNTGHFSTITGTNIIKMFDSMKAYSLKTWIFGDGLYKGEGLFYYGNVDVGFLRHILYFGIIGCIFVFVFYFYCYKKGLKYIVDPFFKKMWVLIFLYMIIAHVKGDFLLGNGMGISLVMILYFTIIEMKDQGYEKCFNC